MSFSLLSTCRPTAPNLEDKDKAVSLTTLDFFTVLVKGDLKFYTYGQVGLRTTTVRNAGRGGHSTIEIGTLTRNKSLVAVKRYHLSAKFQSSVEHHRSVTKILGQLTRELRILSHEGLRKHPHIIDIVGVCAEQANGSLDWAIVLEYASHGTLATFLKGIGASTSGVQRADMILGVARGLQALHQLGICHGDIKAENSLVFPKGTGGWVVKISDFGQAIFPAYHHPRGRVECPAGTRLLEAPEIRKGEASMNPEFDIQSALRTDVFSFGLLAWEVMKRGQRFFDTTWIDDGESANVDSQERFLNMLPEDGLLAYGLDFVQALELDKKTECAIMDVMRGTLKDESQLRKPMHQLVELFHRESPPLSYELNDGFIRGLEDDGTLLDGSFNDPLVAWTTHNSVYELLELSSYSHVRSLRVLPVTVEARILTELQTLASTEEMPSDVRAETAMIIAECYAFGFGGQNDAHEAAFWLRRAASLGLHKAVLWHHRICAATGSSPTPTPTVSDGYMMEKELKNIPSEFYLISRIHFLHRRDMDAVRRTLDWNHLARPTSSYSGSSMKLSFFNPTMVDEVLPIHIACWLGEDNLVRQILQYTAPGVVSTLGLNLVHYACLGGHISTLEYLLSEKVPVKPEGLGKPTPLHFCIFFPPQDIPTAVNLLLKHGCRPEDSQWPHIKWDAHDLDMIGNALEWAILARYRLLVQLLLPHYSSFQWENIHTAVNHSYWDILEDLLPQCRSNVEFPDPFSVLGPITHPFRHWIAHGSDHAIAIRKMVQLLNKYYLPGYEELHQTHLRTCISNAIVESDLVVIQAILSISSPEYVKYNQSKNVWGDSFAAAFRRAGHNVAWYETLKKLADFYSLEELGREHESFLENAISTESLLGVRVLLERGVDVNKPFQTTIGNTETAIYACVFKSKTPEMLSLLMDYGADILAKDEYFQQSPIHILLTSPSHNSEVLDLLLQHDQPDAFYVEVLHTMLLLQISHLNVPAKIAHDDPEFRADREDQFRRLLTHPRLIRHVDAPDVGVTPIQRAANSLHLDTVRLLLDAGADAGVPFISGEVSMVPLQISCTVAGLLYGTGPPAVLGHVVNISRRAQAMDVATELLKWHIARGDGLFEGITELHLACRMNSDTDISRLLREGYDLEARGRWPGISHEVSPRDLRTVRLEEEEAVLRIIPEPTWFPRLPGQEIYARMCRPLPYEEWERPAGMSKGGQCFFIFSSIFVGFLFVYALYHFGVIAS